MFIPQIPQPWVESTCTRVLLLPGFAPAEKAEVSAILNKLFSEVNGLVTIANGAVTVQFAVQVEKITPEDGAAILTKTEKLFQDTAGRILTTYVGLLLRIVYRAAHRVLFTVGGVQPMIAEGGKPEAK